MRTTKRAPGGGHGVGPGQAPVTRAVSDAVWRPGPLWPAAVLARMSAEGLLVEVLDGTYLPADLVGDRRLRVAALGPAVVGAGPVALRAAAWLHGAPTAPRTVDVLAPRGAGPRAAARGLRPRRLAWRETDVTHLYGVAVTTPLRTAVDLARTGSGPSPARGRSEPEPGDVGALGWLLSTTVDVEAVSGRLDEDGPLPGTDRARRLLEQLTAQG